MATEYMVQVPLSELRIGFGRRFAATLLDGIIVAVVSLLLNGMISSELEPLLNEKIEQQTAQQSATLDELDEDSADAMMTMVRFFTVWTVVVLITGLLYYGLTEIFLAASPGKMMLGIKIASQDGTPASTQALATRWFIKSGLSSLLGVVATLSDSIVLSVLYPLVSFIVFIGYFFVFGEKRQALHDLIAKTAVYRREHIQHQSVEDGTNPPVL
ncbi:MAG: RDD family protein [Bacteroidota bacterium]|nr:RDD family protein [Candidatus Kapabacteria bacterium]MCS7303321.1 RDD family protein [Candidatus Kapabacteria bacterium]MDW8271696.1 RDD family protein [Bacteroidota bacterium]